MSRDRRAARAAEGTIIDTVTDVRRPPVRVWGPAVDAQTRCVHWHSPSDVVAIEFACCRRFFPCHSCHAETADHPATT